MVNFLYPMWLWGLLLTPLIYVLQQRHTAANTLIASHLQQAKSQQGQKKSSKSKPSDHHLSPLLSMTRKVGLPGLNAKWLSVGWFITLLALSGPHWRQAEMPVTQSEQARVLVMDMSLSMLGEDIKPSRYTQSIFKTMDLLPQLEDGYTGVVAYTADAYIVSPLTHDTATIRSQLPNLSPNLMPIQGKNAATGVERAIELLSQSGYLSGDIVLITSGISEREQAAISALLKKTNYRLSAYPLATTQGTPIFDLDRQILTDGQGQTVVSRLTPSRLRELTRQSGGIYVSYRNDNQDIERLSQFVMNADNHLGNTQSSANDKMLASQVINDGYWLVWIIAGFVIFSFRRGAIWSLALVLALPLTQPLEAAETALSQVWKNNERQAFELYEQGHYEAAAQKFDDPMWQGSAWYEHGDYHAAVDAFERVGDSQADYNLANAYAQIRELEKAAMLYRKVLSDDPEHLDAAENLALVESLMQNQDQENQEGDPSGEDSSNGESQEPGQDDSQGENQDQQGDSQGEQSQDSSSQSGDSQQEDSQGNSSQDSSSQDSSSQNAPSQNSASQNNELQGDDPQQNNDAAQPTGSPEENGEPDAGSDERAFSNTEADQQAQENKQEGGLETGEETDQEETLDNAVAASPQAGQLEEGNPVLNKLDQIPDDRARLLRNQMILQARERPQPSMEATEW